MDQALQIFENHEVRVVEQDNETWFPVTDLAAAWGIDRSTPGHIIDRNKESFEGLSRDCDVTSQTLECVNERGLYLLIGKVSTDRLKNPEARSAIIRFQRWVPELIQKYRKGEIQQQGPTKDPLLESLNRQADIADALISRFNYQPGVARNLAMQAVVLEQGERALMFSGPARLQIGEASPD